jgi:hypothetical protein
VSSKACRPARNEQRGLATSPQPHFTTTKPLLFRLFRFRRVCTLANKATNSVSDLSSLSATRQTESFLFAHSNRCDIERTHLLGFESRNTALIARSHNRSRLRRCQLSNTYLSFGHSPHRCSSRPASSSPDADRPFSWNISTTFTLTLPFLGPPGRQKTMAAIEDALQAMVHWIHVFVNQRWVDVQFLYRRWEVLLKVKEPNGKASVKINGKARKAYASIKGSSMSPPHPYLVKIRNVLSVTWAFVISCWAWLYAFVSSSWSWFWAFVSSSWSWFCNVASVAWAFACSCCTSVFILFPQWFWAQVCSCSRSVFILFPCWCWVKICSMASKAYEIASSSEWQLLPFLCYYMYELDLLLTAIVLAHLLLAWLLFLLFRKIEDEFLLVPNEIDPADDDFEHFPIGAHLFMFIGLAGAVLSVIRSYYSWQATMDVGLILTVVALGLFLGFFAGRDPDNGGLHPLVIALEDACLALWQWILWPLTSLWDRIGTSARETAALRVQLVEANTTIQTSASETEALRVELAEEIAIYQHVLSIIANETAALEVQLEDANARIKKLQDHYRGDDDDDGSDHDPPGSPSGPSGGRPGGTNWASSDFDSDTSSESDNESGNGGPPGPRDPFPSVTGSNTNGGAGHCRTSGPDVPDVPDADSRTNVESPEDKKQKEKREREEKKLKEEKEGKEKNDEQRRKRRRRKRRLRRTPASHGPISTTGRQIARYSSSPHPAATLSSTRWKTSPVVAA